MESNKIDLALDDLITSQKKKKKTQKNIKNNNKKTDKPRKMNFNKPRPGQGITKNRIQKKPQNINNNNNKVAIRKNFNNNKNRPVNKIRREKNISNRLVEAPENLKIKIVNNKATSHPPKPKFQQQPSFGRNIPLGGRNDNKRNNLKRSNSDNNNNNNNSGEGNATIFKEIVDVLHELKQQRQVPQQQQQSQQQQSQQQQQQQIHAISGSSRRVRTVAFTPVADHPDVTEERTSSSSGTSAKTLNDIFAAVSKGDTSYFG